ncbi:hypothetical protein POTOM_030776 [Populus tomentosa]|uniref:3-oxo-5-alpha-steroid 4-dehydrogenase C-terminal domain-containing protein n=1 Tax=Populus tomentosa TaxID=118781 RepID=A0A8X7Z8S2_POPTO|nr:hypothetical protein POTOM_030776 [Populus tomentosa]
MASMLSSVIFPPPPSLIISVMSVVSLVAISGLGISEILGKHLQYSRFWNLNSEKSTRMQVKLSSRTGMLVFYVPAFLSGVASFVLYPNHDLRLFLVKATLTIHFFKRTIEVLFVHKYSTSGVVLDSAILISSSYFSATSSMIHGQYLTQGFPEPQVDLKYPGVLLFLLGISGNLYHHLLLASLRTKSEKEYKIPKGGLFGLVICPHYLFEVLGFIGILFISQTLYPLCFTVGTIVYLMGRSYATRRWYLSKFEDFPKDVKALIPYVVPRKAVHHPLVLTDWSHLYPSQSSRSFECLKSLGEAATAGLSFSFLGLFEGLGKNFKYSKFSNFNVEKSTSKQSNTVCSRDGMLVVYIPAFLSAVAFSGLFPNVGLRFLLVKSALTIHFFKRILEVLFVHKYSGGMAVDSVIFITLGYFTTTSITIYALSLTQGFPEPPVDLKYPGVVLFLVGIVGNFYHHHLLSSLRTKNDNGYKVPKGGLFGYVGLSEIRGKHLQYSKFLNVGANNPNKKQIQVSSRTGTLIAYTLSFLAGAVPK